MSWAIRFRSPWQSLLLMLRRRCLRLATAAPSANGHARFAGLARDVVSEEVWVAGLYEAALLLPLFDTLLAPRRPAFATQVALDVGANIGNHSLFLARHFHSVLAAEPNPTALALLRCNLALAQAQQVAVLPLGLGDRNGRFEFMENRSGNLGGSGFAFSGLAEGRATVCELRRGDEVVPERLAGRALGLVKLDVEGAELSALQGLSHTLAQHKPVVLFENHGAQRGQAVIDLLRGLGYRDFWVVEEAGHAHAPWRKLLRRLVRGERIEIKPLVQLEDRAYAMLVALAGPGP